MSSKKRSFISAAIALAITATSAYASNPSESKQSPRPAADVPESTSVLSTVDASELVRGYLEYVDRLRDRSDVSLERMQSAIGNQLRREESGSGDTSSVFPEGDWITLSFSDADPATGRAAILHFGSDREPNGPLPFCRLSFESLRGRLLRAGYAEDRECGELGEVVAWLFSKDDFWIEVGTRLARPNDDLMCVWTVYARG